MIHWIAGKKRGVEVEDWTKLTGCCWGHLPSRGGHEADGSRADCEEETIHVDQGWAGGNGNVGGGIRGRWNASFWTETASGSP